MRGAGTSFGGCWACWAFREAWGDPRRHGTAADAAVHRPCGPPPRWVFRVFAGVDTHFGLAGYLVAERAEILASPSGETGFSERSRASRATWRCTAVPGELIESFIGDSQWCSQRYQA